MTKTERQYNGAKIELSINGTGISIPMLKKINNLDTELTTFKN